MTSRLGSHGHFVLKADKSPLQMSSNVLLKFQLTENLEQETQDTNLSAALTETKLEHEFDVGSHVA